MKDYQLKAIDDLKAIFNEINSSTHDVSDLIFRLKAVQANRQMVIARQKASQIEQHALAKSMADRFIETVVQPVFNALSLDTYSSEVFSDGGIVINLDSWNAININPIFIEVKEPEGENTIVTCKLNGFRWNQSRTIKEDIFDLITEFENSISSFLKSRN